MGIRMKDVNDALDSSFTCWECGEIWINCQCDENLKDNKENNCMCNDPDVKYIRHGFKKKEVKRMKLPIKDKYFKEIKEGKKFFGYRDAHITFINEKTGETLRKDVAKTRVISCSQKLRDLGEYEIILMKLFGVKTIDLFKLDKTRKDFLKEKGLI